MPFNTWTPWSRACGSSWGHRSYPNRPPIAPLSRRETGHRAPQGSAAEAICPVSSQSAEPAARFCPKGYRTEPAASVGAPSRREAASSPWSRSSSFVTQVLKNLLPENRAALPGRWRHPRPSRSPAAASPPGPRFHPCEPREAGASRTRVAKRELRDQTLLPLVTKLQLRDPSPGSSASRDSPTHPTPPVPGLERGTTADGADGELLPPIAFGMMRRSLLAGNMSDQPGSVVA